MNTIEIKTYRDFEMVCDDLLTDFLDAIFDDQRYIETMGPIWKFTIRGRKLYSRYVHRLTKVGEHRFPNDVLTIRSWLTFETD